MKPQKKRTPFEQSTDYILALNFDEKVKLTDAMSISRAVANRTSPW